MEPSISGVGAAGSPVEISVAVVVSSSAWLIRRCDGFCGAYSCKATEGEGVMDFFASGVAGCPTWSCELDGDVVRTTDELLRVSRFAP